jgi:glycosyltransferase involved in cell wall biosynthesis
VPLPLHWITSTEGRTTLVKANVAARLRRAFGQSTADASQIDALSPAAETVEALRSNVRGYVLRAGLSARAQVAVITRTLDRPLLLDRAMRTVLAQTFGDLVHVVVNDGGDRGLVEEVIGRRAEAYGGRLEVLHLPQAIGMEAAANAGVRASQSEYIVLLDDDDSWSPWFLERCLEILDGRTDIAGVVTQAMIVREEIAGDRIVFREQLPMPPYDAVTLGRLAEENFFPTNSFVFRRSAYERVGGFGAHLKVQGDWDFNYSFLKRFDVAVLPQTLAYYHHRTGEAGRYGNTVIAGYPEHRAHRAKLLNESLRADLAAGRASDGLLLFLGDKFLEVRKRLDEIAEGLAKPPQGDRQ